MPATLETDERDGAGKVIPEMFWRNVCELVLQHMIVNSNTIRTTVLQPMVVEVVYIRIG